MSVRADVSVAALAAELPSEIVSVLGVLISTPTGEKDLATVGGGGLQTGGVLLSPKIRSSTSMVLPAVVLVVCAVCLATTLPM